MTEDRDLVLRLERWLQTREVPVSASRLSEEILGAVATIPQDGRLVGRLRRSAPGTPFRLLAVAAILLLALGGLTALLVGGSRPAIVQQPRPTSPPSLAPTATASPTNSRYPEVVRAITLPGQTWQVLATPSRTWVQTDDVGLSAIDPATGLVSGEVPGGSWMFLEGDDLWVQLGEEQALVRVDPITGLERERFENIPGFVVAKDGGTIWSVDRDAVVRTDLATGERLATIEVPPEPKQIVLAAGSVWVACDQGSALVRIDPATNEVVDTIDAGTGLVELEFGFGSLWVRNRDGELVRVDPETATVSATIDGFPVSPSLGLSFGGGFVWAAQPRGMGAIDPDTNQVVREIPLPGATYMDSYWLDGTLWVTTAFDRQLLQVDAGSP